MTSSRASAPPSPPDAVQQSHPPERARGVLDSFWLKSALALGALAALASQLKRKDDAAHVRSTKVVTEARAEPRPMVSDGRTPPPPPPPPAPLRWFRGNLHAHSLRSDGTDPPEVVLEWYRSHGYDFAALTEHNTISEEERWTPTAQFTSVGQEAVRFHLLAPKRAPFVTRHGAAGMELRLPALATLLDTFNQADRFLVLPGEEITGAYGGHPVHVNAINLQRTVKPQLGPTVADTLNKTLDAVVAQELLQGTPTLKIINHPNYKWTFTPSHLAQARAAGYVDIMNGNPNTRSGGDPLHPAAEYAWDTANALRLTRYGYPPLQGIGVDDMHRTLPGGANPGRAWVMVHADSLDAASLIAAMDNRRFYASSGVALKSFDYDAAEQTLEVEIAEEADCRYSIDFVGVAVSSDLDERLRKVEHSPALAARLVSRVFQHVEGSFARYHADGHELFVRAVVTSSRAHPNPAFNGQRQQAWTPVFGWKTPHNAGAVAAK